ncbi:WD40-repeat-containing domain protein [Mycena rosella]|uniref:WD40-repeat-containing domain protein n=1 Tax=Mycena rosella TaxID=1033263 RepID=A0AAD7DPF3_MYCRO|nr:WD40-repeat-containing domain protein [Mycena rosella]
MATPSREYSFGNLHGGTGGAGGNGEHSGPGGVGEGPTFIANVVNVDKVYGPSTISAGRAETHILPYFAPKALFDADAAAGGPARRACTDNTRVGLISRLKEWARDAQSLPIFWLSGMAGTGKSTVAYTLCEHWRAEGRLGASFFCSRNDEKARDRASIIPTIVQQLLPISKPFAHSVENAHIGIIIQASTRHVAELLVQPWLQAMASQQVEERPPLVVVIDALDEIEGNIQGPHLIKQLVKALSAPGTRLSGLKFFLASRPHPRIEAECSSIERKAVYRMEEITPKDAIEDVRRFVDAELPDLPAKRREGIVTNSAGLFIYAATISRYVCPPTSDVKPSQIQQVKRLDRLGENGLGSVAPELLIGSLYKAIVSDVLHNDGQEVETSKRVLYAAITTRRPLTVLNLTPLLFDADDEVDEMAVRNSLSLFYAVLYVSPRDQCIYTFHKSFTDFILDPHHSHILFRKRTYDCVRIMNNSLHFDICNLPSSFLLDDDDKGLADRVETNISSELRYACLHWAAHLASVRHDRQEDMQLSVLLLNFYKLKVLFWMEAMHLLKLKSDCRLAINLARTWVLQVCKYDILSSLDGYMAAVQRLWASFVQGQASLSTPHLYVSSLATELALTSAATLTNWRKHFPRLPSIECKGIPRRGMLLMSMEGHRSSVWSVAFSPDGTHIVSGSSDNTVRMWDVVTGAEVTKMKGHSGSIWSVAFSPDGTRIVSGSDDKTVRIWDVATGAEVAKMEGHSGSVWSLAFSPDSTRVVSASYYDTVRIWDVVTGAEVTTMEGHRDLVLSVAFSSDGTRVVSGSCDKTVRIWDATTGAEVTKMEGHSHPVRSVAFSLDGMCVVSGSCDETVRIWDVTTGAEVTKIDSGSVGSVAFSLDSMRVVSGSDDKTVRIWDAMAGAEVTKMEGHRDSVRSVAFSLDSMHVVSGSDDKTMRIWDAMTGTEVTKMEGHRGSVWSVAFSPDSTCIVSGSSDNTVRIWDVPTGAEVTKMKWHRSSVQSVAFSPDGLHIVSGSDDETLRIWDATTGAEVVKMEHSGSVKSVAFAPDGTHIVSGSSGDPVQIWDAMTGAKVKQMERHSGSIWSLAFSPDGTRVVSASYYDTVRIWDVVTGAEVTKMKGHRDLVLSVAFSSDGTRAVSGSYDKTVRIWDATTGAEVTKMEGHSGFVWSVAFSPDSTRIVSGSSDNTVRIWDAATGAEVTKMVGHSGSVRSVAFSPDGMHVVSGSEDKTVRIWDATTGAEVDDTIHLWICQTDGWMVLRQRPHHRLFWYPLTFNILFLFPLASALSQPWVRPVSNFILVLWGLTGNKSTTLHIHSTLLCSVRIHYIFHLSLYIYET